jgi:hypothetical protein
MAQSLSNGSPRKWREHPDLLQKIFKLDKPTMERLNRDLKSKLLYAIADPIEFSELLGDWSINLVDDWITAEITCFKMVNYIENLNITEIRSKVELVQGTYLGLVDVDLDKWLISAALFAQATRSLTGKSLASVLDRQGRNRPVAMLTAMRIAVKRFVEDEDDLMTKRYLDGDWLDVSLSIGDEFRNLNFQVISPNCSVSQLNELGMRSIGRLSLNPDVNVVFDGSVQNAGELKNKVAKAFKGWVQSHRRRTGIDELLPEFIHRYNMDRRYLLGWKLINPFLRYLLIQI